MMALLVRLAIFLVLLGMFFVASQLDPGGYLAWFMD
jgi:hypothetical protein